MKPQNKTIAKKELKDAIKKSIKEGKINVFVDAKPCSIEITKGSAENYNWKIKLYVTDGEEMFNSVRQLKQIENEIKKQFLR